MRGRAVSSVCLLPPWPNPKFTVVSRQHESERADAQVLSRHRKAAPDPSTVLSPGWLISSHVLVYSTSADVSLFRVLSSWVGITTFTVRTLGRRHLWQEKYVNYSWPNFYLAHQMP